MNKSNIFGAKLLTTILLILSSILFSGCKSEPQESQICIGEAGTGVAPDCSTPKETKSVSSIPTPSPVVYDVICFQAVGLAVDRTMCSSDDTYKIPRNTEVTVYPKKETSVQQGTNTTISFDYKNKIPNGKMQKINIPEMESLASQGANVYTMYYHLVPVLLGNSEHYVEVEIFNNKLGGFKMFDQDKNQVVFVTGDTKVRVEKPARKEGLMGDMQAVQNGGIYRKKIDSTKPAGDLQPVQN
jgi:hypothetical protein